MHQMMATKLRGHGNATTPIAAKKSPKDSSNPKKPTTIRNVMGLPVSKEITYPELKAQQSGVRSQYLPMHQMMAHQLRMQSLKDLHSNNKRLSDADHFEEGRSTPIHGKSHAQMSNINKNNNSNVKSSEQLTGNSGIMTTTPSNNNNLGQVARDLFGMPKAQYTLIKMKAKNNNNNGIISNTSIDSNYSPYSKVMEAQAGQSAQQ